MKYTMGNFGEAGTVQTLDSSGRTLVATAGDIAEKSLQASFDKVAQIAKAKEVEEFIKNNNLGPYLKDLNADRVKTFLAFLGFYTVYKAVKSPVGIAALAGVAIYIVSTSSESSVLDKVTNTVARSAKAPDAGEVQLVTPDSNSSSNTEAA